MAREIQAHAQMKNCVPVRPVFDRDPFVVNGMSCVWTAQILTADGRLIELCVVGDPDDDGPSSWDVTGSRNREPIVFGEGEADSFAEACAQAIARAMRASIQIVGKEQ